MRFLALLLLAVSLPKPALAAENERSGGERRPPLDERGAPAAEPIDADDERPVPDYDGRGSDPTTTEDVLLWIPRVLLFPLYVVSEFVVRRPLGLLATTAEKENWHGFLRAAFGGGDEGNQGFVPTGLLDYGFRASGGIYIWANDLLVPGHETRFRAATGGFGYWNVVFKERIPLAVKEQVMFRGEYDVRSDWVFHGLGPESPGERARFRADRLEGTASYEKRLWRTSSFGAALGIRDVHFDASVDDDEDPSVAEAVASGRLPGFPTGFGGGYTVATASARAAIDTRPRRHLDELPPASDFVSPPGGGLRLAVRAEQAVGLRENGEAGPSEQYHWLAWGGTLAGFADVGEQRVMGLSLIADFVDPLHDDGRIPFTELASLGGARPLRGFLHGRLLDRSAVAAQLDYQYPIWTWLDGAVHYAAGNVFGAHLEGFDPALFRSSFGMGFRSAGSRDHVFEVLVAFGTDTYRDGAEPESFRFVVGATSGF